METRNINRLQQVFTAPTQTGLNVTADAAIVQSERVYSRSEFTTLIGSRSLGKGVVEVADRKQSATTSSSGSVLHVDSQSGGAIVQERGGRRG